MFRKIRQQLRRTSLYCVLVLICCKAAYGQSYVPEFHNAKMKVKTAVPVKAYAFNLSDIRITGGLFKKAMDLDGAYLLEIEPDRLLSRFYKNAGLAEKGIVYGGWESETISGHTLGHYLSACSIMFASTGDSRYKAKCDYLVAQLYRCQQARKTGYVGAVPNEDTVFAQVARGDIRSKGFDLNGAWVPWYTLHKVMAGLLDTYLYTDNRQSLTVLNGIGHWISTELSGLSDKQLQLMLECEHGGMNEALVNLYAVTANPLYLRLSYKFHHKAVLDSLAKGIDVMQGRHSNTNIPKVIGVQRRYEITGSSSDSATAAYFWKTIVNHHTYANGGNSNYEYLGEEDKLNDRLSDNTTETCNTYNMLKLTRHLFAMQPGAGYTDYYERALYNHILASQDPATGMMCYFLPLRMGGQKSYSDKFNSFWCCVGSGMENHVKYGEGIYSRGADAGLYVNLFIPSRLAWKERKMEITQETGFPETNETRLLMRAVKPADFTLYIREPAWSAGGIAVFVNGKPVITARGKNGYVSVTRRWANRDSVRVVFHPYLYTQPMPDNANRVAILYGPVLLAGDLGHSMPDPVYGTPVLLTASHDVSQWLSPVAGQPLTFRMHGAGKPFDTQLSPFYAMSKDFYSVYWDYFTPDEWTEREASYVADKRRQQATDQRTIDIMRLGEMQPERDHHLQSSINSYTGNALTRTGREARAGGFFSFDIQVDPRGGNILLCTYSGDDKNREFELLIDGTPLATVTWNGEKSGQFYDVEYPIPENLTRGKTMVKVTVSANRGKTAGRIFGCRMLRPVNP